MGLRAPRGKWECVAEVPLNLVRGNQLGILLSVIASLSLKQPLVLLLPLAVQLVSRWFGIFSGSSSGRNKAV